MTQSIFEWQRKLEINGSKQCEWWRGLHTILFWCEIKTPAYIHFHFFISSLVSLTIMVMRTALEKWRISLWEVISLACTERLLNSEVNQFLWLWSNKQLRQPGKVFLVIPELLTTVKRKREKESRVMSKHFSEAANIPVIDNYRTKLPCRDLAKIHTSQYQNCYSQIYTVQIFTQLPWVIPDLRKNFH